MVEARALLHVVKAAMRLGVDPLPGAFGHATVLSEAADSLCADRRVTEAGHPSYPAACRPCRDAVVAADKRRER